MLISCPYFSIKRLIPLVSKLWVEFAVDQRMFGWELFLKKLNSFSDFFERDIVLASYRIKHMHFYQIDK